MDACTLLLPGLGGGTTQMRTGFASIVGELIQDLDLSSFAYLYSRGTRDQSGICGSGPESLCCAWFQLLPDAISGDWPLAALAWLGDDRNAADGGVIGDLNNHPAIHNPGCVRIEPVHLQLAATGLVPTDPNTLGLRVDESEQLAALAAPVFAESGLALHTPLPNRWYLTTPAAVRMQTTPLIESIGIADPAQMPRGADAPQWMRLLNQVQMQWHDCDVNRQREQHDQAAINSFWIGGTGSPPDLPSRPDLPELVMSNEPTAAGIAALSGLQALPLANNFSMMQVQNGMTQTANSALVIDTRLYRPAQSGDWGRWRKELEEVHKRWILPAWLALRLSEVQQLEIIDEHGWRLRIRADAARHWWRFPRSPIGWWKSRK